MFLSKIRLPNKMLYYMTDLAIPPLFDSLCVKIKESCIYGKIWKQNNWEILAHICIL